MKKIFLIVIAGFAVVAGYSAHGQNTNNVQTASVNLVNVPVENVLEEYKSVANAELIVASNVPLHGRHGITLRAKSISGGVLRQMMEQALLKQAGIVITHIDDKRISVTFNDQLKLEQ